MQVHVHAYVMPAPVDGWESSGYDLPVYLLDNERTPAGFATIEQAAPIAADVALYGRAEGTRVALALSIPDKTYVASYVVRFGRLERY